MVSCVISNVNTVYASDSEKIQMQDYTIAQGEIKIFINNIILGICINDKTIIKFF